MKKFAFSTDHEKISANIGIPDERNEEMINEAREVSIRAIFWDKDISDVSTAIELFLNAIQPKNDIEFFWAGYVFGDIFFADEKNCGKSCGGVD